MSIRKKVGSKLLATAIFPSEVVSKGVKKLKSNYNYFKMGRRAEFDEENKRIKESNIKRLKGDW